MDSARSRMELGAALMSPSSALSFPEDSPRVSDDRAPLMRNAEQPDPATPKEGAAAWTPALGVAWRSWVMILTIIVMSAAIITIGVMHWRSHPAPTPMRMQALILGSNADRFASSAATIRQAFPSLALSISSVPMVPLTDPRVEYRRRADTWAARPRGQRARRPWEQSLPPLQSTAELRALSTSLGWMDLWARAGADPTLADDDWILMFEDDVALVPQPAEAGPQPFDYTHALLELLALPAVLEVGIVYLGACGPQWAPLDPAVKQSERNRFNSSSAPHWLSSRRATAFCTHAMAFTKRRARSLPSDLATFLHTSLTYQSDTNLRLLSFATQRWPFVLGAERRSPIIRDHFGLFFQGRKHHKSIINQREGDGKTNAPKHATGSKPVTGLTRPRNSEAPIASCPSAQMQAWILTSKPERFRSSVAAIERAFPQLLNITAIAPVPLSDPRIEFRRRSDAWEALSLAQRKAIGNVWRFQPPPLSNVTLTKRLFGLSAYFGWMDMWSTAGNDPALADDDWVLMFEDDVALVWTARRSANTLNYTAALLELLAHPAALDDGIVSLGACDPQWAPSRIPEPRVISSSVGPSWLSSRRALGMCMHAMAFTKRRARTLHSDISAYLERDREFIMDVDLRRFGRATDRWPFLFGDKRRSPQFANHRGLFYQDRKSHRSIIDGAEGGDAEHADASTGTSQPIAPHAASTRTDHLRAPGENTPFIFPRPPAPASGSKRPGADQTARPSPAAPAPPFPAGATYRAPSEVPAGQQRKGPGCGC